MKKKYLRKRLYPQQLPRDLQGGCRELKAHQVRFAPSASGHRVRRAQLSKELLSLILALSSRVECPKLQAAGPQSTLAWLHSWVSTLSSRPFLRSVWLRDLHVALQGQRRLAGSWAPQPQKSSKQRRQRRYVSSARPFYCTKTTKSQKYAGSGCGFKSIDTKNMRRNHNFNLLQSQKTDVFIALNLWKMKSMKSLVCSLDSMCFWDLVVM